MSTRSENPFDAIAATYDADFTHTVIGNIQRRKVYRLLRRQLPKEPCRILEINCGTGTDAIWLTARGHQVIATDASSGMIGIAQQKSSGLPIAWEQLAFDALSTKWPEASFDFVFSNFGGLNCIDERAFRKLNTDLHKMLKPGGRLILVLMAKHCLWERLYFMLRKNKTGSWKREAAVSANLAPGITQQTWYYATKQVTLILGSFHCTKRKPIGLFIPPSYLEHRMKRHPLALSLLKMLERLLGNISWLANYGDHVYMVFERKNDR